MQAKARTTKRPGCRCTELAIALGLVAGVGPHLADEAAALLIDFLAVGEEVATDAGGGGEFGECSAEGFDGEPAVVAGVAEGFEVGGPGDVAGAGGAAVVGRN